MKTSKLLEARENANDHAVDVLSLASDWLRWWREFPRPMTERRNVKPKYFGLLSIFNWKLRRYTGLKSGCNFALHRFNFQSDWPPHLSYQSIHFPWGVYVSISQPGWLRIDKKIEWDNSFHPTNLINEFTFRRSGNSLNVIKLHFLRLNQFFLITKAKTNSREVPV